MARLLQVCMADNSMTSSCLALPDTDCAWPLGCNYATLPETTGSSSSSGGSIWLCITFHMCTVMIAGHIWTFMIAGYTQICTLMNKW